jgi:hypothetical protein
MAGFGAPGQIGPGYASTIGPRNDVGQMFDPNTGRSSLTGKQKGTNAGEALRALQEASGLNLLGGSSSSGVGGVGGGAASLPPVAMGDAAGASAAAFGRAKDQAGQTARASLTALHNEMAGRNMLGSGAEGGETARIVGQAAGASNEMSREQAIQDAKLGNQRAMADYQGRITQRGQDINAAQANASRQQQALEGLLSVINSSGILY